MPVIRLTYESFLGKSRQTPQDPLAAFLANDKTVHVFALTRDLCPGCEIQKPLYEKLADGVSQNHGDQVKFYSIHVSNQEQFREKLQDFRRILKFAAYPTYLILLKTGFGTVETYRAIEPPMKDIERNIDVAVELVTR